MRKNNRGQAAFEFLMTYGWVFIIIVLVLGALSSMGLLNPNSFVKKGCVRFTNMAYKDHKFDQEGTFVLRLGNEIGEVVRIESIEVIYPDFFSSINNTEVFVYPGDHVNLVATGAGGKLETHSAKVYSANVRVKYSLPSASSGFSESATCSGTFE